MNWETLLCFGDSITIGARSYMGYPEYTGDLLAKHLLKDWNVINHATSGFTAIDLVRSVDTQYANLKQHNASVSTILIGTNDLKAKTPTGDLSIALNQLILKAKLLTTGANVILIRIPALSKGIMYPYNFGMNGLIVSYNQLIDELAEQHRIRVMSFSITEDMLFDGVHLNDKGSRACAKQLASFILKDKGI